jgi:hypothetical protein
MKRVFISSTSRDLGAYRKKAIEICNRMDLHPIAMEFFEAMSAGATEGSLRKMENTDLYIGIFAYRYGYIEDGYDKSVTEVEFDHAFNQQIERLCFVVDPQHPWPPDAIDYANYHLIERLKHRIDRYQIRSYFTTVDDFGYKLSQALFHWQRRHDHPARTSSSAPQPGEQRAFLVPPRPSLVIGRDEQLNALIDTLAQQTGNSSQPIVVRGWPGVGKTTFLSALTHEQRIEDIFSDGVLWASLGEEPDLFQAMRGWLQALGIMSAGTTVEEVQKTLRKALNKKRILLIVDDVWATKHGVAFQQVVSKSNAFLITTRFDEIARQITDIPGNIHYLKELTDDQSHHLLSMLAPNVVSAYPDETRSLVTSLEGLPLSIRVVGRLLSAEHHRAHGDTEVLIADLAEGTRLLEAEAPTDRMRESGEIPTILEIVRQSTDRLEPDSRRRFAMLGSFAPKPATFDVEAMQFIWDVTDGMPIIRHLVDRGLLEPIPSVGRYQMHAILVAHAKNLLEHGDLDTPVSVSNNQQELSPDQTLHPHIDDTTTDEFRALYLKPLYQKLRLLERRKLKGKPVEMEMQQVLQEIMRLGGKPDDAFE